MEKGSLGLGFPFGGEIEDYWPSAKGSMLGVLDFLAFDYKNGRPLLKSAWVPLQIGRPIIRGVQTRSSDF